MKLTNYIVLIFLICFCSYASSQEIVGDTITAVQGEILSTDSLLVSTPRDTVPSPMDSIMRASTNNSRPQSSSTKPFKVSSDQPDQPIDYGSADSSYLDLKENQIHLFGKAFVKYGKYNLDAGYIIFDFDDNEAAAFDTLPSGIKTDTPQFKDGTNEFASTGLRYNFKSNKGMIYDAITTEGEFQVLGSKTKFVSSDADSLYNDDQIYNQNAVITTCTNPIPHFGIRARKLKVVPNKIAVAGFSQLELAGIPTPVVLPFGFYPLVDGLSSGIIFPADFDTNPNLGLGVRGVGYYFPISDYMDLTVTGDFYTRGTHRIYLDSKYKKRYKYSGTAKLYYANNIVENPEDLSRVSKKGFSFGLTRTQDPKAHPYTTIGGSINISTGDFYATNFNDFDNVTRQTYTSNFFYRGSIPDTPFSFNVGMSHNQNTQTSKVNITLPDAKLTMKTIYPFKKKIPSSQEAWYEKINVTGSSAFKTFVSTTDTTLFEQETLDNLETGMYNKASAGAPFKLFKYLNVTPNASVDQYLFLRTLDKDFNPEFSYDTLSVSLDQDGVETIELDTTYGVVEEKFVNGFDALHRMNFGVSMQTQIFGTKTFAKGWLRGLRTTVKPSLSFNYSPNTLGRQDTVQFTSDPNIENQDQFYNPFQGGSFNPSLSRESMSLGYGFTTNIQGKKYVRRDSTTKKFDIFRDIRVAGSYNFAADSLNMSQLSIRGNTKLNKYMRLNANLYYDFYVRDEEGDLVNQTVWSKNKRPVAFDRFDMTITSGMNFRELLGLFGIGDGDSKSRSSSSSSSRPGTAPSGGSNRSHTSFLDEIGKFRIDHSIRLDIRSNYDGTDTTFVGTHSLRLSGSLNLTPKWTVRVQNIQYDFVRGNFVYPAFTLARDLHCWEMNFSWYPQSDVYGFFIGVKSSTLSFLKYNYGQQNTNALGFGRR